MEESHEVERQKTIIIRRAKKMDKGQTIKMQEKCKQGRWN
jgi:ribosome-associated protein YbcJ (S4-like RNA binding protein)